MTSPKISWSGRKSRMHVDNCKGEQSTRHVGERLAEEALLIAGAWNLCMSDIMTCDPDRLSNSTFLESVP